MENSGVGRSSNRPSVAASRARRPLDWVQYRLADDCCARVTDSSNLLCHPASPCSAVPALRVVTCALAEGGLQLRFELRAQLDALRIPAPAHSGFADELWRHTCFEVFVGASESVAYREFNFSPSGQWAAYAFTDYRQRDLSWLPSAAPYIATQSAANGLVLEAQIPAALLPSELGNLHIGLSAVIETADGALSYWALTHPSERPDFHQRAAFTLRLASHDTP